MRDFGFWVRMVAITQLFGMVLANYGDGWLSPDNAIFTIREERLTAEAKEKAEAVAITRPARVETDSDSGAGSAVEQYSAGWAGFDPPEMPPVAEKQPDYVRNGSLEPDTSEWGHGETR